MRFCERRECGSNPVQLRFSERDTHTSNIENEFWFLVNELDENEDYSLAIDYLNCKDNFQPFGMRLSAFIANKLDLPSKDRKTVVGALTKQCEENGVALSEIASDGTLRNWFDKDKRPKKGDDSRRSMFALAFALCLSVDETKDLFHKIYLDRAFNYRDEQEIIFYFCLKNRKNWFDAKRLIAEADTFSKDYSDKTQLTNIIADNINTFKAEQDLLDYLHQNGHNFERNSVTARKKVNDLLVEAKLKAKKEIQDTRDSEDVFDESGKAQRSYKGKWINEFSNNFLFERITGVDVGGKTGTKTVFKNAALPKEIKNRFPEALTFGKDDMTSEEYRKVIILLFSYCQWIDIKGLPDDYYDIDDYTSDLNNVLFECCFSPLYYGNPFDWLFLFCAQSEEPLVMLREILSEVLPNK